MKDPTEELNCYSLVVTHDVNNAKSFSHVISWSQELSVNNDSIFIDRGL